jgi:PPOX class probable F420-dependent enzyme
MDTSDPLLADLLDHWPVARLASLTPQGRPHGVPIVFCRDGAAVYSPIDGKTKQGGRLQREANIASNPQVSLLLDEYGEDWAALWWVRLDGEAQSYSPAADHATRLRSLLLAKYPQYAERGLLPVDPGYLRIVWNRATAWAQTDLQTSLQRAVTSRRA